MKTKAILVMVHGSRVKATADELNTMIDKLNQQANESTRYFPCYMEIQSPSLAEALPSVAEQGYQEIDLLPLFVLEGRHVREDIPEQFQEAQKQYPNVKLTLQKHIGAQDVFLEAILKLL